MKLSTLRFEAPSNDYNLGPNTRLRLRIGDHSSILSAISTGPDTDSYRLSYNFFNSFLVQRSAIGGNTTAYPPSTHGVLLTRVAPPNFLDVLVTEDALDVFLEVQTKLEGETWPAVGDVNPWTSIVPIVHREIPWEISVPPTEGILPSNTVRDTITSLNLAGDIFGGESRSLKVVRSVDQKPIRPVKRARLLPPRGATKPMVEVRRTNPRLDSTITAPEKAPSPSAPPPQLRQREGKWSISHD